MGAFKVGDAVRVEAGSPVYHCNGYEKPPGWAFGRKLLYTGVSKFRQEYAGVFVGGEPGGETFCSSDFLEPWNDAEEWNGVAWVAKKPKFKVGDRVKIVGKSFCGHENRIGETVTINCVYSDGSCGIQPYGDAGNVYKPSSLELVRGIEAEPTLDPEQVRQAIREVRAESAPKPAIVCLREDGKLALGGAVEHASTNAAFSAAQRAAEMFPGREYVVLQEKGSKRVEPKPTYPVYVKGDVLKAVRDTQCSVAPEKTKIGRGRYLVVCSNSESNDPFFNADVDTRWPALPKADFVKVGHVDI